MSHFQPSWWPSPHEFRLAKNMADQPQDIKHRGKLSDPLRPLILQHGLPPASAMKPSPNAYLQQMDHQRFPVDWTNAHLAPDLARPPEMTSQRLTPELAAQRATPEMVRLDPAVVASYLGRHGKSPPPPPQGQPAQLVGHHLPAPSQQVPQSMFLPQSAVGITALTQTMRKPEDNRQPQPFPSRHVNRSPVHGRTPLTLADELQKPVSSQPWTMLPQSNYLSSHPAYSRQASAPSDLRDLSKCHVPPTQLITNNNSVNQNANMSQIMAALNMSSQHLQPPHASSTSLNELAALQQQVNSIPPHELNKLMRLLRNGQDYSPSREELPPFPDESGVVRTGTSPDPPVLARDGSLSQDFAPFGDTGDFGAPAAGRLVPENPFFPPGMKVTEKGLAVPDVIVEDENGQQIQVPEEGSRMVSRSNPFSMRVDIVNKFPQTAAASRYRAQHVALHRAKAGCILGVAKSLDLLRQNLQKGFNKEIEQLLTKYVDNFFKPAVANIRRNQGESAVTDDHLNTVRRQLLDEARKVYSDGTESLATPGGETSGDNVSEAGSHHDTRKKQLVFGRRRKHSDSDSEASQPLSRKKKGRPSGRVTPSKIKEPVRREGPKWDPERITDETLFVMGAKANKALGLGNTRGRLYIKHPDIFKYTGDQDDKEWLFAQGRMPLTGGRTYILLYDDIKDLSESPEYVHTPMLMHILTGFSVPGWMQEKMRMQMGAQRTDKKRSSTPHGGSRAGTPSVTPTPQDNISSTYEDDGSLDQFELNWSKGKLPFSQDSRSDLQPSPATDLDLLSNADDPDLSPLARSTQFDVSPIPDVSPSPSDLDGIDEEPPLSATFDLGPY